MKDQNERYLIISFHDLAPHSKDICQYFLEKLQDFGIHRTSLLVVPNWYGKKKISEDPDFITWLKDLKQSGHEIVLHGLRHQTSNTGDHWISHIIGNYYTNKEGEFYQVSYDEAQKKLQEGTAIFEQCGLKSAGFIAPAWLLNRDALAAVRDLQFDYTVTWGKYIMLQPNHELHTANIVFSSRSAWRRIVSQLWCTGWYHWNKNTKIMRLAVHPIDFHDDAIERKIFALIEDAIKTRQAIAYHDLFLLLCNQTNGSK